MQENDEAPSNKTDTNEDKATEEETNAKSALETDTTDAKLVQGVILHFLYVCQYVNFHFAAQEKLNQVSNCHRPFTNVLCASSKWLRKP